MAGSIPQQATEPVTCPRCGLRGARHADAEECIDALRDHIARLSFKIEQRADKPSQPTRRGGRRERKDNRFVLLDGERLTLAEAGRRLGLTASSLHFRILRRTKDAEYREVDLRAIGADVPRRVVATAA
jgi:hypothetical protein